MEVIIIVIAIIAGFLTGVVTGIIPGIHVNTIASLMVSISAFLYGFGWDHVSIAVFIASVAVTHSFFDYIPSLFLGVPNDEVFSLLPGHRMVKEGRGLQALHLSIQGSWNGILMGVILVVVFLGLDLGGIEVLHSLDELVKPYLFWILIGVSVLLMITESNKLWAVFLFSASGLYGMVVFASPLVPGTISPFSGLFPALTGIFGVSGLILSLFEKTAAMPKQDSNFSSPLQKGEIYSSSVRGTTAGIAVGLLPGLGGANAATLLFLIEKFLGKRKKEDTSGYSYIVTTSAINTSDTLFGIAALYFIEKSRSGASVAMSQLFNGEFTILALVWVVAAIVVSAMFSVFVMKKYSLALARILSGMNDKALNTAIIVFISILVYFTTGVWGLVIMVGGAFLGMIAPIMNVRRAQAMGFFLVPVILFYSGYQREISSLLRVEAKTMVPSVVSITDVGMYLGLSILSGLIVYVMMCVIFRKGESFR